MGMMTDAEWLAWREEEQRLNNELLWNISHAKFNPLTGNAWIPKGNPFSKPKDDKK